MKKITFKYQNILFLVLFSILWSCNTPKVIFKEKDTEFSEKFVSNQIDTNSIINWRTFFDDTLLCRIIDTALGNNQELNILIQEIAISQSEVLEKKGEYKPFVRLGLGSGIERAGRYTRNGAIEHNLEIIQNKQFPNPLSDFMISASSSWEIDVWRKLRNAKDAAHLRYLAVNEARNFFITQLISEIAQSYYELIALDNLLSIVEQNIEIQQSVLENVLQLKEKAKLNQLAVNRFEAQLLNTTNHRFLIKQKINETENKLYYLSGKFPTTLERKSSQLISVKLDTLKERISSQHLNNRPDLKQAELQMLAAKLDVKVAKANFYPKVELKAGIGFQAFNPNYLISPESIIYDFAWDILAPLINRKAIQAQFNRLTAKQIQTVYSYHQTLLYAYTDVLNQLAKLDNYSKSVNTKAKEVKLLQESVEIATSLFQYAKADYVEVLLTQEEVLNAQMELVESKLKEIEGKIQLYRALGGGWN